MFEYSLTDANWKVILSENALSHITKWKQSEKISLEAGGQLFARFCDNDVIIEKATGPRKTDKRSRDSFFSDQLADQLEIEAMFKKGLHYVGDWHTHPTELPVPSRKDIRTIKGRVKHSTHNLNGFIILILGIADLPDGVYVAVHDGRENRKLDFCGSPLTVQSI